MSIGAATSQRPELFEDYDGFVEKFKPKKTTDDCYTPPEIYDAVLSWVRNEYGIDESATIIRPFYPGGDYEREEYPQGCVVVDNPPFSILASIVRFYHERGVHYFLFAPALTTMGAAVYETGGCAVCASATITYENGAQVHTSFVTDLEDGLAARSAPDLHELLERVNDEIQKRGKVQLPTYDYPYELLTAARLGWMSTHGTELRIKHGQCVRVSALDAMKGAGKSGVFGGGLLLAERAAAERAAAERAAAERAAAERLNATVWQLSDRERAMLALLDKQVERRGV